MRGLLAAVSAAAVLAACSSGESPSTAAPARTVTVFAAASLTSAFTAVGAAPARST